MPQNNIGIKLKRSVNTFEELASQELNFGQPFFIDGTNGEAVSSVAGSGDSYLVLGRKPNTTNDANEDIIKIENSPVIKCVTKNRADNMLFRDSNNNIITEKGEAVPATNLYTTPINTADLSTTDPTKYYLLFQGTSGGKVRTFTLGNNGIYATGNGVIHGAAWNDYAETRSVVGITPEPGQVVCDTEYGLELSAERLQPCSYVVSDTFGYILGDEGIGMVPVAVAGRALVYVNGSDIKIGDCVCADAGGFASVMTRDEIINYPDRILGVVSEIPTYKTWKEKVPVNGRVWIKLR